MMTCVPGLSDPPPRQPAYWPEMAPPPEQKQPSFPLSWRGIVPQDLVASMRINNSILYLMLRGAGETGPARANGPSKSAT